MIVGKLNANPETEVDRGHASVVMGGRLYIAYFVPAYVPKALMREPVKEN